LQGSTECKDGAWIASSSFFPCDTCWVSITHSLSITGGKKMMQGILENGMPAPESVSFSKMQNTPQVLGSTMCSKYTRKYWGLSKFSKKILPLNPQIDN
jgi:hypothetical protein